ncbi:hypothetical protein FRX31_025833 [Thalictrum thalictroides]|uniref:Uncharacterized protein n=1 Tax=Thalictrum thalictroides TaxID=46969 RepID=A0A7J6VIP4_THATH|nr:hypothetical protein FRX31_025833 [Thalictrum thalictroides]
MRRFFTKERRSRSRLSALSLRRTYLRITQERSIHSEHIPWVDSGRPDRDVLSENCRPTSSRRGLSKSGQERGGRRLVHWAEGQDRQHRWNFLRSKAACREPPGCREKVGKSLARELSCSPLEASSSPSLLPLELT